MLEGFKIEGVTQIPGKTWRPLETCGLHQADWEPNKGLRRANQRRVAQRPKGWDDLSHLKHTRKPQPQESKHL